MKDKKKIKKRKGGILGSIASLEESLNQITYDEEKDLQTKLSKKERQLIE